MSVDNRLALEIGIHAADSAYDAYFRVVETLSGRENYHASLIGLAYMKWKAEHAIAKMREVFPAEANAILAMEQLFEELAKKNGTVPHASPTPTRID